MLALKQLKASREELIEALGRYYERVGRKNPPPYPTYELHELRKCIVLHGIDLRREGS